VEQMNQRFIMKTRADQNGSRRHVKLITGH